MYPTSSRARRAPPALRDALCHINSLTAQLTTIAGELAHCRQTIEEQARTLERINDLDPLTLLANRRCLAAFGRTEFKRALVLDMPFSVLMLDVDNFKSSINDRFGHADGDFCLVKSGKICMSQVRDELDLVVRYGGEEILILLPGLDERQAALVAERIRAKIAAYRRRSNGCRWTVTIGVAGRTSANSLTNIIAAADAALYVGKSNGKNQVVVTAASEAGDCLTAVA